MRGLIALLLVGACIAAHVDVPFDDAAGTLVVRAEEAPVLAMPYLDSSTHLRGLMLAAGCEVSDAVDVDLLAGGLVVTRDVARQEVLASCPVTALLSSVRGAANALSTECQRNPHCCVPLQVLDADGDATAYPAAVTAHLALLPETGAHWLLESTPKCVASDMLDWRTHAYVAQNISCKDHPDHGYLPRVSLEQWVRYQAAVRARAFASNAGEVLFPLFDTMTLVFGADHGYPDNAWVHREEDRWVVRAPTKFHAREPLLRRASVSDSLAAWALYGRVPSAPTSTERVLFSPEQLLRAASASVRPVMEPILIPLERPRFAIINGDAEATLAGACSLLFRDASPEELERVSKVSVMLTTCIERLTRTTPPCGDDESRDVRLLAQREAAVLAAVAQSKIYGS